MEFPVAKIKRLHFGTFSDEEIVERSHVKITSDKMYAEGGVCDPRMGPLRTRDLCPVCHKGMVACEGHFGYVDLAMAVGLRIHKDSIKRWLQAICFQCGHLLHTPDSDWFRHHSDKNSRELLIALGEKTPKVCPSCEAPRGALKLLDKDPATRKALDGVRFLVQVDKDKESLEDLGSQEIRRILDRVQAADLEALGIDPTLTHPRNFVPTKLQVMPNIARPPAMQNGHEMYDDLNVFYSQIVRANNDLGKTLAESGNVANVATKFVALETVVNGLMDNTGHLILKHKSGRTLASIMARFTGKTGRFRGNLMGKRVDFSARTVITPDPTLRLDQVGIPRVGGAMELTVPETVNKYNRARLQAAANNGPDVYPGANRLRRAGTKQLFHLRNIIANGRDKTLQLGDVVHRHLLDGDVVLFNRQPSLHRMSIMQMFVKVHDEMTFQFHPSNCKPYNADFDGDEMNLFVPQDELARAEATVLMTNLRNMVSPRHAEPIITVIQDTLTGAYVLTAPDTRIPQTVLMDMLAKWDGPYAAFEAKPEYTGAEAVSFILPPFSAVIKSGGDRLVVRSGKLLEGQLNANTLIKKGGLLHVIHNNLGPHAAKRFIEQLTAMVQRFLLWRSFSIGLADMLPNEDTLQEVNAAIDAAVTKVDDTIQAMFEGRFVNNTGRTNQVELELQIKTTLAAVEGVGNKIAKTLPATNQAIIMVRSGAKAKEVNVRQMMGTLGQQLISGKRAPDSFRDRALPHFCKYDRSAASHGFVANSFVDGLSIIEFFFLTQGARDALIDTATKTPETGYMQRKYVKLLEDLTTQYDGTLRTATGRVVQQRFSYLPEASEYQTLPLAEWSNEQIAREFGLSPADLAAVLTAEALEEANRQSTLADLVPQLRDDRDYLVRHVFMGRTGTSVIVPVDVSRILENDTAPTTARTDLTPGHVVARINELAVQAGNTVFAIALRFTLAPKKVIVDSRLTRAVFDALVAKVRDRLLRAEKPAGHSDGVIAAQSTGEPLTQFTLNSFHSAGTSEGTAMTSGVPRARELTEGTHSPATPACLVFLEGGGTREAALELRRKLQLTKLIDLLMSEEVWAGAMPVVEGLEPGALLLPDEADPPAALWVKWQLSRAAMDARGLTMAEVVVKLEAGAPGKTRIRVASTDDNAPDLVLAVPFPIDTDHFTLQLTLDKLRDVELSGLPGISRVFMMEVKKGPARWDRELCQWVSGPEWMLQTEGINLLGLMNFPGVDASRVWCNNFWDVAAVWGVEAARTCFLEEFLTVFEQAAAPILPAHLELLASRMFVAGTAISFTRFGLKKSEDVGPLTRMTFEQTDTQLSAAAAFGEMDKMQSPSANIMFGQVPQCGTGKPVLLLDTTMLPDAAPEQTFVEPVPTKDNVTYKEADLELDLGL